MDTETAGYVWTRRESLTELRTHEPHTITTASTVDDKLCSPSPAEAELMGTWWRWWGGGGEETTVKCNIRT